MDLILSVLADPSGANMLKHTKLFTKAGGSLGRSADNYWVLPDPDRVVSSKHAQICFAENQYFLVDTSTNGTYYNDSENPLGKGNQVPLKEGDIIALGEYKLKVSVRKPKEEGDLPKGLGSSDIFDNSDRTTFSADAMAKMKNQADAKELDSYLVPGSGAPANTSETGEWGSIGASSQVNTATSDSLITGQSGSLDPLLAFEQPGLGGGAPESSLGSLLRTPGQQQSADQWSSDDEWWKEGSEEDHVPAHQHSMQVNPSQVLETAAETDLQPESPLVPRPPAGGLGEMPQQTVGNSIPPSQFDQPQLQPIEQAQQSQFPPVQQHSQLPPIEQAQQSQFPPVQQHSQLPPIEQPQQSQFPPVQRHSQLPPMQQHSQFPPVQTGQTGQTGQTPPTFNQQLVPPTMQDNSFADSFAAMEGQQVNGTPGFGSGQASSPEDLATQAQQFSHLPEPPVTGSPGGSVLASALGLNMNPVQLQQADQQGAEIVRETVARLIDLLRARNSIKNELRVQRTMIQTEANNPLKFSVTERDALEAMFAGTGAFMNPAEAVKDSFDDLSDHQVAVLAGMRAGYSAMLKFFSPENIERRLGNTSSVFSNKNAKKWEGFTAVYRELLADPDNCYRKLFGDEFAVTYENQLSELKNARSIKN
ncbi:type VI secretion system-associated FHA domain protein TagH [Microbulbifer sp. ZKSA006]|uniref:type VI secretion system-associated FHA domain protein TagH n=1 Tax=Microbulbifer sp. ZKSA006 TaxID=3243390 RepID=UPI004039CDD8